MSTKEKEEVTASTVQSEVIQVTQAEIDALEASSYQSGITAERERITQIQSDAEKLDISRETVQMLISNGSSAEQSNGVLMAVRAGIDKANAIHTAHKGDPKADNDKGGSRLVDSYQKAKGKQA